MLPRSIEARVFQLVLKNFSQEACAKFEILGCHKTNCIGKFFGFIERLEELFSTYAIDSSF